MPLTKKCNQFYATCRQKQEKIGKKPSIEQKCCKFVSKEKKYTVFAKVSK